MKILVATDGSRQAVAAARALADWFPGKGTVDLLAVIPPVRRSLHPDRGVRKEVAAGWRGEAGRWLDATRGALESRGFRVRIRLRTGDPATVAAGMAAEGGYDLVVAGARGRRDAPFLEVGSVALALLEQAPGSVLLVRERDGRERRRRTGSRMRPLRVLVAVDGGDPARRAVGFVKDRFAPASAAVEVLAVADAGEGGPVEAQEARGAAKEAASLLGGSREVSPRVETGPAAAVIAEAAAEADLLVLGSRSAPREGERRVGSVSGEVARFTPCSVLVVRGEPSGRPVSAATAEGQAVPLEVTWKGVDPTPALERLVLRGISRLERAHPGIERAGVVVERQQPGRRRGNRFAVSILLQLPGENLVHNRFPDEHVENETLAGAVSDAFLRARRPLSEGRVVEGPAPESSGAMAPGRISALFPDYGFIETTDGRSVYFHRNSVLDGGWGRAAEGVRVHFREEAGVEGPQASSVRVLRRR